MRGPRFSATSAVRPRAMISWICSSDRPLDIETVVDASAPVLGSRACTVTMPSVLIEKATSIFTWPRGPGSKPENSNSPSSVLPSAWRASPW